MPCPNELLDRSSSFFIGNGCEVLVKHFLAVDNRAYLQQVERPGLVLFTVHGSCKFDFYRTAHFLLSVFQCQLQNAGQRKYIMLQDIGEGDNLASARI